MGRNSKSIVGGRSMNKMQEELDAVLSTPALSNLDDTRRLVYRMTSKKPWKKADKAVFERAGMQWNKLVGKLNGGGDVFFGMRKIFMARILALDEAIKKCNLEEISGYFQMMWPHWFINCQLSGCEKLCRPLLIYIIFRLCFSNYSPAYANGNGNGNFERSKKKIITADFKVAGEDSIAISGTLIDGAGRRDGKSRERFRIRGRKAIAVNIEKTIALCAVCGEKEAKYEIGKGDKEKICEGCVQKMASGFMDGSLEKGAPVQELIDQLRVRREEIIARQ